MLNKKFSMLTICLLGILFFSFVSAADNNTGEIVSVEETTNNLINVDETTVIEQTNTEKGIEYHLIENNASDYGTFGELQVMFDVAGENGRIYLEKDYVNDGSFSSEGINITKAIIIIYFLFLE